MKPTLLSLLTMLLLFVTSAHAEETTTAAPTVTKNIGLKIQLFEVKTEAAILAGLDRTVIEPYKSSFNVFMPGTNPIAPILDVLLVADNAQLLMTKELATESGVPTAVHDFKPLPEGMGARSANSSNTDPENPTFPGQMGYMFRFTPTVDEKDRITMRTYMLIQSPGITREQFGRTMTTGSQAINTSLRFLPGTTVSVGNVIPNEYRTAIAQALQATAVPGEPPVFLANAPTPDTTTYLLVTPYIIEDR